jgi:hypothetical protein
VPLAIADGERSTPPPLMWLWMEPIRQHYFCLRPTLPSSRRSFARGTSPIISGFSAASIFSLPALHPIFRPASV